MTEMFGIIHKGMKQYEFAHWNGKKIKCFARPGLIDYNTLQSAIHHDEYGFKELGLKKGDVVIDIGAYIGGEGIELAAMGLGLQVYSYDPLLENLDVYLENVRYLRLPGIHMFPYAVGGHRGMVKFKLGSPYEWDKYVGYTDSSQCKVDGAAQTLHPDNIPMITEVPQVMLADIFGDNLIEHCAVLKMDCEGTEMDILRTSHDLFDRIDWIVGECHGQGHAATYELVKDKFLDQACDYKTAEGCSLFRFKHR
jgi:FkbM family methyltransferase